MNLYVDIINGAYMAIAGPTAMSRLLGLSPLVLPFQLATMPSIHEPVHIISRLDPYYEPGSMHLNRSRHISLLHRFHIGREPDSLTLGLIHNISARSIPRAISRLLEDGHTGILARMKEYCYPLA
ncbi:unnamed protein product [Fusarium graminearum]|uniref:Uncharacterized protein n=1 Tax=Gibberella zeae TaxID=5518 RepID=A0A9N8WV58_GIBZA|nr:unnamed protein product [Fusarium graminearum]CAG1990614.1 unnamed protein product [Fusarium graminearum]